MANAKKQVVFLIVEGPSEETALASILKGLFETDAILFHVVHGDITTGRESNNSNIVARVAQCIDKEMKRYGLKQKDILRVIHITDTDAAYIPAEHVTFFDGEGIQYTEDSIQTKNVKSIQERNEKKKNITTRLVATNCVHRGLPYSIFYFSRNMEHVLHNRAEELSDWEKEHLSYVFADQYENDLIGFNAFIKDAPFAVPGTYRDTWKFILCDTNSLHRYSNFHLLLESLPI